MFVLNTFGALSLQIDGRSVTGSLCQKRRLAVLAILAASGRQGLSRQRAANLLWPESNDESARHSLAQLLYSLRHGLPEDAVAATGGNLALNSAAVSSDVADFDAAIQRGDRSAAVEIYRGPFLEGFHLPDASEFEEWRCGEAERRARQAASARQFLAREAERGGRFDESVEHWRLLAVNEPLDSTVAVSLMRALDAVGNRPGALQFAAVHESLVRDQLGIPPDPAVAALVDEFRRKQTSYDFQAARRIESPSPPDLFSRNELDGVGPRIGILVSDGELSERGLAEPMRVANADSAEPGGFSWKSVLNRSVFGRVAAGTALVVVLLTPLRVWRHGLSPQAARTDPFAVAVLPFSYHGDSSSVYLREGIVELMSVNFDGAGGLKAINPRTLLSYAHELSTNNKIGEDGESIARHFNANFFLMGDIVEAGGKLRITASIYERTPRLRIVGTAAVDGQSVNIFPVLDALTTELLAAKYSGRREHLTQTAARTTYSIPALKAHLLGEQLFHEGRYSEAVDAFESAVNLDSTFALAYYRLATASEFAQLPDLGYRAAEKAVAHSQRLSEHDRKLVLAYSALRHGNANEAERLYEEVLSTHPDDVEAWFQLGEVLFHLNPGRGRSFLESRRAWVHVLELSPGDHFALLHLARVLARERSSPLLAEVVSRSVSTAPPPDKAELRCFRAFTIGTAADRDASLDELRNAPAPTVWQSAWRVGVYAHDLNGAERIARLLVQDDLASERSLGNVGLMLIMLGRGRVQDAGVFGSRFVQPVPWSPKVPSPQFIGLGFSSTDTVAVRELRDRLRAWKAPLPSADSDAEVSYENFRDHQRRYLAGLLSVRLGDGSAALAAAQILDTMQIAPSAHGLSRMFATAIRADLALTRGKPHEALRLLEQSDAHVPLEFSSPFGVEAYIGWLRAESLRLLHRDREALPWYASRVDLFMVELPYLGPMEFREAQTYERLGDRAQAIEHYRRFLTLWGTSDPEFLPIVSTARAHLAALSR